MSFRVVKHERGEDCFVATAFAWYGSGAIYKLSYDGNVFGGVGMGEHVGSYERTCSTLAANQSCTEQSELCLTCVSQSSPVIACN